MLTGCFNFREYIWRHYYSIKQQKLKHRSKFVTNKWLFGNKDSKKLISSYIKIVPKKKKKRNVFVDVAVTYARKPHWIPKKWSGAPNVNFRKISVRKTIWDLEFSEHLQSMRNLCVVPGSWTNQQGKIMSEQLLFKARVQYQELANLHSANGLIKTAIKVKVARFLARGLFSPCSFWISQPIP